MVRETLPWLEHSQRLENRDTAAERSKMKRETRSVPKLLILILVIWMHLPALAADRPNVLFLLTDDQRSDTVGALGNADIRTPNLDRLACTGFVFRNAYCMGSTMPAVCNPSRHMIHSGKALYDYDPLDRNDTFGDVLRKSGYETWHVSKRGNVARVYHTAFEHSSYLDDRAERTSGHHGREGANRAIRFLMNQWNRKRPFFMYLGFAGPHDPRVAADQWMQLYRRESLALPPNYLPYHPFDNGELLVRDERLAPWPRRKSVVRRHLHDYYACISSIDHHIGRILDALDQIGQLKNTLIVFSSDHGLAVGSHGLFGKQNLYEHSTKSPLIICGPGIPRGETAALAYLFDIFPTVAELCGVTPPEDLDGLSLGGVIAGEQESVRDSVFLAYRDVQRAVRHGRWKFIRYPQVDVTQLFDLQSDPSETNNLAHDPAYSDTVRRMMQRLQQQQERFHDDLALRVDRPRAADVDAAFFESRAQR